MVFSLYINTVADSEEAQESERSGMSTKMMQLCSYEEGEEHKEDSVQYRGHKYIDKPQSYLVLLIEHGRIESIHEARGDTVKDKREQI